MTDGNWILNAAIKLMDEELEGGNPASMLDTAEYRQRTVEILNVLRHEVYSYSSTFVHGRVCPELGQMDQPVDLDDDLAQGVLPYGLAAHLLLGENNTMAVFFQQRYEELIYRIGTKRMAQWEDIVVN